MSERELRGLGAAGGVAVGRALVVRDAEPEPDGGGGPAEAARASAAMARLAEELGETADRLRRMGMTDEAEILEANRLMAADPALLDKVYELAAHMSATAAVRAAAEHHAQLLADVPDPLFAARAADARQLGRRAARLLGGASVAAASEPSIFIGRDLGPADVADLDLEGGRIRGIALAEGAATSHAAIMARALGVPMVVGLGEAVFGAEDGETVVLDGDAGGVTFAPGEATLEHALTAVRERQAARHDLARLRGLPSTTRDGRHIRLLCNAATEIEARAGLDAGAEGVGLLRTELAFLDARAWPTEDEHGAALAPVLAALAGRVATVRTLDFGADKTPPFLAGIEERGIALSLAHPESLAAQFRAISRTAGQADLRIMVPLVGSAAELRVARAILERNWDGDPPPLGAMIETPGAVKRIEEIAAEADFLSIGTNDLVQYTLGLDRELPLASARAAGDPAVLRLIGEVERGASAAGLTVEICGEAASELPLVALFVGLGIGELSIAPARVDDVRAAVRGLSISDATAAAAAAVVAKSAVQALEKGQEALLGEAGDQSGELLDSLGGAVA
jgi:phosphoenolpyruvate-protein kinase (PTS system EI component)